MALIDPITAWIILHIVFVVVIVALVYNMEFDTPPGHDDEDYEMRTVDEVIAERLGLEGILGGEDR